jgi:hypothetical protein
LDLALPFSGVGSFEFGEFIGKLDSMNCPKTGDKFAGRARGESSLNVK